MRSGTLSPATGWKRPFHPSALAVLAVAFFCSLSIVVRAAELTGRVVDPDGRPVPNAHVVVTTVLGAVADARTGPAGEYGFPNLPDGRYDVEVFAEGFQATPSPVELSGTTTRDLTVTLRLSAVTESIVVSASQIEVARSTVPASVTVISGSELRLRQVETVADALRQVPGLTVTRSGGRGALTSLLPRGGSSNYTLVLVDGIRTNSFGGGYDFAHLSVANIERIEIVRGPQSALYGSEAIGAVVQVITRRGGPPRAEGLLEAGSQGTVRTTVGVHGSRGRWAWGAGAERAQSDGYNGRRTADGETIGNDDYSRWLTRGTLSYQKPNGIDATLAASAGADDRGFPGPWGADPAGAFSGIDRVSRGANDTRRIGLRVDHSWSRALRQRAEASYTDVSGRFSSAFGPSSSGTRRFDGRLQEDVALHRRLGASVGLELVREQGRSTYVTGGQGQAIPIDRQVLGSFGEARLVAHDRLQVTGGIRVEHLTRRAVEADPLAFSPRPAFPEQTVTSFNPKIAATYRLSPATASSMTRLRASAGTGIRPPDVFEIAFTDNPGLKPERSRSTEVGIEQQFGGGAVVLDAAVFANRYDDLIVTIGRAISAASRYRTDNISNAQARGLEMTARTRLPFGLAAAASYTFLSTELLSVDGLGGATPAPFAVGDPLIRRPRHLGSVDLSFTSARMTAFGALTSRSRVLDLEPNFGSFGGLFNAPGFAVLDLGASVPVRRGLELFARINNVADRRYEETLGFPALGRNGLVGVRVAAGR